MPTLWPAAKYSSSDGPIKAADRFLLRTTGIAGIGPKEAAATRPTLLVSTRKRAQTIRREAKTLQVQSAFFGTDRSRPTQPTQLLKHLGCWSVTFALGVLRQPGKSKRLGFRPPSF
jgi:hypothetical protein